ncbi:MAG TPA: hypothetical protein VMH39_03545 [Gemmatimonadaceae bacterium]|nr:hypothetical protein [Gemmatimonadaceae bacterium]
MNAMLESGRALGGGCSSIELLSGFNPARARAERELADHSVDLPLPQRADWQRAGGAADSLLLVARDSRGAPLQAMSAAVTISRTLPGHRLYRVERFSPSAGAVDRDLHAAFTAFVRSDAWSLRAHVRVFDRDATARRQIGTELLELGFTRLTQARVYDRTLMLDLSKSENDLFAALSRSARRNVRAAHKRGLRICAITDPSYGPRLASLVARAFQRTRGESVGMAWDRIIELSILNRNQSRLAGLFDDRTPGVEGLVAFAWGCCHGSYVTYEAGGSVRRGDLGNAPLGYAPLWDLIAWARASTSASWFDLGGIDRTGTASARRGIAEFKRFFSEDEVEVGEEWLLEPHAGRAAIARRLSAAVRALSDLGFSRSRAAFTRHGETAPTAGGQKPGDRAT